MRRQLAYLGAAVVLLAIGVWLVVDREAGSQAPIDPIVGVYRIAAASVGPSDAMVEQPALVGRAFVVRRDGPELVAGLCPDELTCTRWLDETPTFRHSLASLPVDVALAQAEPEVLLSAAHVVDASSSTTITTEDGRCRRRVDAGSLERTEVGVRLRRELAQTELAEDCESLPVSDRVKIELSLLRLHR